MKPHLFLWTLLWNTMNTCSLCASLFLVSLTASLLNLCPDHIERGILFIRLNYLEVFRNHTVHFSFFPLNGRLLFWEQILSVGGCGQGAVAMELNAYTLNIPTWMLSGPGTFLDQKWLCCHWTAIPVHHHFQKTWVIYVAQNTKYS